MSLLDYCAIVCFIHLANVNSAQLSIDAQLGNRYQFGLFENHEACTDFYAKESAIVGRILEIKSKLNEYRNSLIDFRNISMNFENFSRVKTIVMRISHLFKNFKATFEVSAKENYPKIDDFNGSIRGLFILHYCYGFDITDAVINGRLSYWNNHYKKRMYYQVY